MQRSILLIVLVFLSGLASGQNTYFEKFKQYFKEQDTTKLKSLFIEWEHTNPNDPELYTSRFNYYFSISRKDIVSLSRESSSKEALQLSDSSGATAGYLTTDLSFNPNLLQKAFMIIDHGIQKFPDRLDMRFGKIYALGAIGDYSNFKKNIIQTLDYSVINKNDWLWTENEKQDDGAGFMLAAVQSYLKQLYDTEDDNLLPFMIEIGKSALKHYPDHIEILSTTSVALLLMKQYEQAILYLKHAESLNPEDFIVLNNIAQAYRMKGDKTNAIKYYELTEKYGDEGARQQAKEWIIELKK
jgi:tetratricopeptide (TPR) repeat protein